jgi:hypothetical protein
MAGVVALRLRCKKGRRHYDTPGVRISVIADAATGAYMADDLKQTGKPDDQRINVDQDHELSYWSEKFGVSRDRLREAVAKAGPMVRNVERELRG